MVKYIFCICTFLIISFPNVPANNKESITYCTSEAEREFLEGVVIQAISHYRKALEILWIYRCSTALTERDVPLKLIEILTISLKQTGDCGIAVQYLKKFLNTHSDKRQASRVIREIILCNHSYDLALDSSF